MLRFLLIAGSVIALLHLLIGLQLVSALEPGLPGLQLVVTALLACSALLIPLAFWTQRRLRGRLARAVTRLGLLAFGWFSSLLVFTLLRDLLLLTLRLLAIPYAGLESTSVEAVLLASLGASLLGYWLALRAPQVVTVDITLDGLPPELDGFTLVQLSDIHVGPTISGAYLHQVVQQVNALQGDVVVITGDVVDGDVSTLRDDVASLAQLQARHGVMLVLGNHELYSGALPWVQEFRRLGLQVLLNEHRLLQHHGRSVAIAGVTDASTARFYPELASDAVSALTGPALQADLRVLLAHQPISALHPGAQRYHLALHGHTHGGQWWPWNYFVRLQQPVVRGLHRIGQLWSYTSVGTGTWGPPKRHFRSEITRIVMRRA